MPCLSNQDSIDLALVETGFGEIVKCTVYRFYSFALCSLRWQFVDALLPSLSHTAGRFDPDKGLDVEGGVIGIFGWGKQQSSEDASTCSWLEDGEGTLTAQAVVYRFKSSSGVCWPSSVVLPLSFWVGLLLAYKQGGGALDIDTHEVIGTGTETSGSYLMYSTLRHLFALRRLR